VLALSSRVHSKSLRVLLIHQAFVGPKDGGGTRHFELGKRLVEMGHQFTVVTSAFNYLTGERSTVPDESSGVEILRVGVLRGLHRSYLWRTAVFVSFMASSAWRAFRVRSVDVVMATSPPLFQALSAWTVAAVTRRPLLLEIRDLWPQFAIELGVLRNRALIAVARAIERFLYGRADHIIVNSPAYRDYLRAQGVSGEKISLIANGVDPSMYSPKDDGSAVRRERGWDGKFIVMYAGALGLANDVDLLLRAADRLKTHLEILFCLVGDGRESRRLRAEADRIALGNVVFLGAQPKTKMPALLAAADVCVAMLRDVPAFRTTYPNKVFDYMAAGRPTVLAIDGVIRKVIERSDGGVFVRPGDDGDLAPAILKLQQCPETRRRMGMSARDYVVKHFNRDRQAQEFAEVLLKLAQPGHQ
jgi:glycosyltransferase involved in cell wall biosynthesis